jgi:D-alanyl-D-alanine carboxypeptidase
MKIVRLSMILLAAAAGCSTPNRPTGMPVAVQQMSEADSALVRNVAEFTARRVAADSFSGVVLLTRDGKTLYQHTTGFANRDKRVPNTVHTLFNLASNDKYFTRIAIRQLEQAGKLSMSDLVGKHLPDYPNARVRQEVTIAHLYSMKSGLGDFSSDSKLYYDRLSQLKELKDYAGLFAQDTLEFTPGTKTSYSNAGYVVLGQIIEQASGVSYYDYVQKHIFDVAGMKGTKYIHPTEHPRNIAIGYTTSPSAIGNFAPGAPKLAERHDNTRTLAARGSSAGGGYSTAADMALLAEAVNQNKLLSPEFTELLLGYRKDEKFDFDGWTGGSQGINTVFYMHTTGHVLIVMSNIDPPSATVFRTMMWKEWLPAWLETQAAATAK